MALLEQLNLSNVSVPRPDRTPTGRFRSKIIEAIDLQLAMVEAQATGTELKITRTRAFRNDEGVRERRDVAVRLRPWWWTDAAGTTFLSLRHGGRVLEIAPGMTAIEVGAVADLPEKLTILREAARAGELDGCRDETARRTPGRGNKEAEGPIPPAAPGRPPGRPRAAPNQASARMPALLP